jgi:hypothetical protein
MANIVVPDAASTPVDHTFVPVDLVDGLAHWQERAADSSVGYWDLNLRSRAPSKRDGTGVYKVTTSLRIPVVADETVNGIVMPKLVRFHQISVTHFMPADGLLQERKDVRKILSGIINDSQYLDIVESLGSPR